MANRMRGNFEAIMYFLLLILWVIHFCTVIILFFLKKQPTNFDVLFSVVSLLILLRCELKP